MDQQDIGYSVKSKDHGPGGSHASALRGPCLTNEGRAGLTKEERTGVPVCSIQGLLSKLSLHRTPPSSQAIPELPQTPEPEPKAEEVVQYAVECDKHDQKETQRTLCAQQTPETVGLVCEYTPRRTATDPKTRNTSPWVDGLKWYSQVKKLEQRQEINRKYEKDLDEAEKRFEESAVMVSHSDMDVRIHAEVEGTEISGTWFVLHGKLPSLRAWIGLFPLRSTKSYVDFVYARGTGGEFHFRGVTPGHYQIRLFGHNFAHSPIAETATLVIGPKVESLAARIMPDDSVLFSYSFENSSASCQDWIGIYERTQKRNKSYLSFGYGCTQGLTKLSLPHKAGVYEARLFAAGSKYNEQAVVEFSVVDKDFLIAEPIEGGVLVQWTMKRVATSCCDWIGLYKPGEPPAKYLAYMYTHGAACGELLLRYPRNLPKGSYQVRIFAAKEGKYISYSGCNFTVQ